MRPITLHGLFRHTKRLGDFLMIQTDKESELNDLGFERVFTCQGIEHIIDLNQAVIGGVRGQVQLLERYTLLAGAMTQSALAAGILDQDPAHGFCGGGEEMRPVLETGVRVLANEA